MGGLYGALCSLRASQGQRADAGVHCLPCGSVHPVGCSGWGAEGWDQGTKCLAGPVVAERTGGQVSDFTACCSLWLSWSGEGWLAALEMWLFAVKAGLEGAQALQASKVLLIA